MSYAKVVNVEGTFSHANHGTPTWSLTARTTVHSSQRRRSTVTCRWQSTDSLDQLISVKFGQEVPMPIESIFEAIDKRQWLWATLFKVCGSVTLMAVRERVAKLFLVKARRARLTASHDPRYLAVCVLDNNQHGHTISVQAHQAHSR